MTYSTVYATHQLIFISPQCRVIGINLTWTSPDPPINYTPHSGTLSTLTSLSYDNAIWSFDNTLKIYLLSHQKNYATVSTSHANSHVYV